MDRIFDTTMDWLLLPLFQKGILSAVKTLQRDQERPFSDGVYFIEIRKEVIKNSGVIVSKVFPVLFDCIFANLFRSDHLYSNRDATKYSLVRIDQSYFRFREGIRNRYPCYDVDRNLLVVAMRPELAVDFDRFRKLMLSN